MKYYVVLVTGGEYFLTPCLVLKASDEETAVSTLKAHNKAAYRQYSIALDRVPSSELPLYVEQGAHLAESPEDIAHAF